MQAQAPGGSSALRSQRQRLQQSQRNLCLGLQQRQQFPVLQHRRALWWRFPQLCGASGCVSGLHSDLCRATDARCTHATTRASRYLCVLLACDYSRGVAGSYSRGAPRRHRHRTPRHRASQTCLARALCRGDRERGRESRERERERESGRVVASGTETETERG